MRAAAASESAALDSVGLSEMSLVAAGVADLDRSTLFYREALGFNVFGEGEVAMSGDLAKAWHIPEGIAARYRVIGPAGAERGLLRLIECAAPGKQVWGDYRNPENLGPFAINIRVPDIATAWQRLVAAGGRPRSEPQFWDILPGLSAREAQYFDPDGTILDVFELGGEAAESTFGKLEAPASPVQTIAIHTVDTDSAKAFYMGLGFREYYDKKLEGLEWLTKLPIGTAIRNVNLIKPELSPHGRIELAEYIGIPGRSQIDLAAPPNTGIHRIGFESANLEATAALLKSLGATPKGPEATAMLPPYGKVRLRTWRRQDGETLEFFQRMQRT